MLNIPVLSPIFTVCEKFDPRCGDSWTRYIKWSGHHHLREIVSADSMLCPSLIENIVDEDWKFNIHADYRMHFFDNAEYLMRRAGFDPSQHNLLALTERPVHPPKPAAGFTFCGYDILDSHDSISILLNCGELPSFFTTADLNSFGLLDSLEHASIIAEKLRNAYPDESHCRDCRVWGVARYTDTA